MKLSNLFNNFVRVAQGLRKGSARPAREWLKSMTFLALLLIIRVDSAWGDTSATYTVSTTTSVSSSGTAPTGSSASYSQDYTTAGQMTNGSKNSHLTLSGYDGKRIKGVSLSMRATNSRKGSITIKVGSTTICSSSGSVPTSTSFNSYVMTLSSNPTVGTNEKITIDISASGSSVFIQSYTITYDSPTMRTVTWYVNGEEYTTGSPSTSVADGGKVSTLPTTPSISCGGKSFVGWTTSSSYSNASIPPTVLFADAADSPIISGNTNFYAIFANTVDNGSETSITGGNMANSLPSSWSGTNDGFYSGNGAKFNAVNQYVQSANISSNAYTSVTVKFKAGKNGSTGSVLTIATLDASSNVITSKTFSPSEEHNSQSTINALTLTAGTTIKYVRITMTTRVANVGMKYCEVFHPRYTYSNYATSCCTELASINGSFSFSNVSATSVTVGVPSDYSDKNNANLEGYIFKRYTASTGGSAVETIETNSSSGTTATFNTGLVANTTYYYTIIAKHSSSSCNSTETSPRKSHTITSYTVSYAAGTGGSGTNPGAHSPVLSGTSVTLKANTFTAPAGKEFAGWNDGSNNYNAGVSYSVTGNKTMTAQWSCITPSISGHPSNASYTEGATPTALSVTASDGTWSYQWKQCATIDGTYVNVASGGTSSTYSPSTASVGTTYYKCVVTNTGSSCNTTATSNAATITITAASKCVAPTFSPAAGTYNSSQTVTISSSTSGSTIYYTTNGSTPTKSSSHGTAGDASASVTVSSSMTLKAIAVMDGKTDSDVSEAAYVICSTDPSFSTTSNSNITITGARITCAGITKGTCDIDAYGIVYGTSSNPTGNAQQKGTDASTNVDSYYVDLTGLTAGTTYYARPYATVNGKTVYGTETSFTTLNIPVITVSETSRAFGTKKINGSYEMTFTVSGNYLQGNIGLAVSGTNSAMFSVDKTSLTPSEGSVSTTTITVTYTPSAAGSHSASVSITSTNATTKTVTLSGTGRYEDTYMTAMHEGVTAWSSYASGVIQTGTGYSVPNPGDIAVGDREGTNCEGKHYHFAGWVEDTYKDSPSGHIVAASGTKDANNTTYWAVWEKESGGTSSSTSITSYEDGDYYIVDTRAEVSGGFFALNGAVSSDAIAVTDIRSAVTENALTGTITIDVTDAVIADAMKYRLTTVGDSITIQHISTSTTVSQKTTDTKFETTGTRNWTIEKHSTDNRFTIQSWFTKNGTKTSCLLMQYSSWDGSKQVLTLTAKPYNSSNMGGTTAKSQNYMSGYVYLVPAVSVSYDDPKVECVCSATADAGTAALNTAGTFSASQIDVKANDVSAGTDCEFTDYGFVWSSSVNSPTLVEGTGAAATNCTKIQVDDEGTVTSFTGSITGSFSAGNAIYFRSYVKNGKADGTYLYSDVVTVTPRSVTFNLNGHGSSTPVAQLVNNGSKATNPSYSESVTGYIFGDWYKEEGCSNAWNFASDVVSGGNKILYAKWTPISYSVRFNDNDENYLGTASGEMSNESYDYDESKDLTDNAFSLAGYDFAGWALTPTGDVAYADKASVSNLSSTGGAVVDLYAIWTAKTYDVTLAATNETSSVGSQTVTATYNAAMPTTKKGGGAVAAPTRTGYTFTGWEYSSTTYYNYNAGTSNLSSAHVWDQPNSTTTLTPKWSINSYTLTWNLDGGTVATAGTGASAGATGTPSSLVEYNSAITVPTVTKAGYNFNGWDVTPASNMPASNTTYTATWTAKPLNNIILAQTEAEIYDQQYVQIDVTYDPADIVTKGYTLTGPALTKVVTTGSTQTQLKISATKAGVTISSTVSETVSIKANADNSKTASVTVTINPLPRVHFVDNIHGETFSDVVETIVANALSGTKTTPTHSDVSDPGASYNTCERQHLHLIGWILSTWAEEHPGATHSQIIGAGSGNYYAAGASINVETHNGDTFYAVWSKIE